MTKVEKRNAAVAKAKAEIEEAQRWLENVPLDCAPLEIVEKQTIVDQWPTRIRRLIAESRVNQ
jgi:hypothetical protein